MIVNAANLALLYKGFNTAFQNGFGNIPSEHQKIATVVPSSTRENHYGWLGDVPGLREWVGDRHVHGLKAHGYAVKNKSFELTIAVDRDDVEDDQYGVYTPRFKFMGESAANHPDELIFSLLAAGTSIACYDNQNFFDTDHPVGDGTASNFQAGGGNPWFLLDTRRALKPLIFQKRKGYQFQAMTKPDDEKVFMAKEFRYGVDARVNGGFGFWQMAYCSKAALDDSNFDAAYQAMMGQKKDNGQPLGVMPSLLVVGVSNRAAAKKVIEQAHKAGGEDNINYKAVELLVSPWLA
jgi:phage major head subunit gpT-like protein